MEKVNHPSHYNIPGRKECIAEMLDKYGLEITNIFCLTNAYKYLYRAGSKEGESQETAVAKARWDFEWVNGLISVSYENLYHDIQKELAKYGEE